MNFREKAEENLILEIRVGSHLFGTDTEDSDLDLYGVFMPFDEIVFGSYRCEEVKSDVVAKDETGRNTKEAVDRTLTEYRKFVRLALQNNPNILHTLFVDDKNIVYMNDFGMRLLDRAELFPHKGLYHRFVKYAESQLHKMRIKPENYKALIRGRDFLGALSGDLVMADVVASNEGLGVNPFVGEGLKGKHIRCGDVSIERGVYVKKARRMLEDRISKATSRASLYTKYGYDVKFGSNLIHLVMESIELLKTGRVEYPLAYADQILDIKAGKYSCEEIVNWSSELFEEARSAFEETKLPTNPRFKEVELFAMSEVKRYMASVCGRGRKVGEAVKW